MVERSPRNPKSALDRLDRALIAARQWLTRPGFRGRVFSRVGTPVELTTIRVLRAVEHFDQAADPKVGDIAAMLGVAPSTASRLVDSVVDRGDLERRPCDTDGRCTRLVLTDEGRRTLDEVTRARRVVLAEVVADWSDDDVELLADALERLGVCFGQLEEGM